MYQRDPTWIEMGPRRLSGLGAAMSCGSNPCGFLDFFPLPGIFTSAACSAYLSCASTGGNLTPTPAQALGGNAQTVAPTPPPAAGCDPTDLACNQNACAYGGGTWDPIMNQCTPAGSIPTSILIAGAVGLAAVVLLELVRK